MRSNITRILSIALALLLLTGSAAAGAQVVTDDEMGGVGGLPSDVDPFDHEPADSVGEWLEGLGTFRYHEFFAGWTPDYAPFDDELDRPWGPTGNPTPTDGDDTPGPCEENPDSLECKSATCDALDDELNEAWEDRDNMTDEEREAWQETRGWYRSNCLNTP